MSEPTRLGLSDTAPRVLPDSGPVRRASGDTNVVFIHGILSGSTSAWTAANGMAWPFILADDPRCADVGIYTFAYRSSAGAGHYRIDDVAASLREFIESEHLLDARHLVIVAHSMGGIVARRWLVSNSDAVVAANVAIGLLLVASPSLGSGLASLLHPLNEYLGNSQLAGLESEKDNQWLSALDADFLRLVADRRFPLVGQELLETDPPRLKGLTNVLVVEAFSGHRYFPNALSIGGSTHTSVCKPESADSDQHRALVSMLGDVRAAGPATGFVRDELAALISDSRQRGHEYLAALDDARARLASALSPQELADLAAIRGRFATLHDAQLALLAGGHLVKADELRRTELDPLQDDALAIVKAAGDRVSADLGRRVTRRYADAPEPGSDPEYDDMLSGRLEVYETVQRLAHARYASSTRA